MRLVDADALAAQIRQEPTDGMYTEEILEVIGNQPTIEAAPVVHGRWKKRGKNLGECSVCGEVVMVRYRYCPDCGAKMDKEN